MKKNSRKVGVDEGRKNPVAGREQVEAPLKQARCTLGWEFSGPKGYRKCEEAIRSALEEKRYTDGSLDAAVDAMVSCMREADNYQYWSHSVCHLFEHGDIFLSGRIDLIKKLIDASVEGAIDGGNAVCTVRILHGLIKYNLAKIDESNLEAPLPLTFESLKSKKFVNVLTKDNTDFDTDCTYKAGDSKEVAAFCTAKTQKELVLAILADAETLKRYIGDDVFGLGHAKLTKILTSLAPEIGESKVNEIFRSVVNNNEMTFTSASENLKALDAANPTEEIAGVYVDVDDTLVVNGKLRISLVGELAELKKKGITIRAFTSGDPIEKERVLKEFKALEEVIEFPVLSKNDFKGKFLEIVVDDTPPELQGFKAKTYVNVSLDYWRLMNSIISAR